MKYIFKGLYHKIRSIFLQNKARTDCMDNVFDIKNEHMHWLKEDKICKKVCPSDKYTVDFVVLTVKCNKFFMQNYVRVHYKTQEIVSINLKKDILEKPTMIDYLDSPLSYSNDVIFLEDRSFVEK